ncbi:MAG: energy-coupling factor transporter ATPase [Oscillospiraceae bacterium]|nr:energy-coupling factor transporter ATPase [Oscillospiraceae bacterium]
MSVAIETQNLTFHYLKGTRLQKTAVNNVSVKFNKYEIIAIIGHTGSGKSSFIQHLNGLLKPSSGKVFVNGEDIWKNRTNVRNVRFKVGVVFQQPEYQLFEDTIYKDIAFGPSNMGISDEEVKNRVEEAVKFVGLNRKILNESPFDVSGGEKRKAVIAGVVAMDPDVLILDELTAGLDPFSRDDIFSRVINYHKIRKNTVIFTSHNMDEVASFAEKVLVLNKGEVAMFDKTSEVFSRAEELKSMSLSVPEVTVIFSRLKKMGHKNLPDCVLDIEGAVKTLCSR